MVGIATTAGRGSGSSAGSGASSFSASALVPAGVDTAGKIVAAPLSSGLLPGLVGALNGREKARCEGGNGGTELLGSVATGSCDRPLKLATATTAPEPTTSSPRTTQVINTAGLIVSSRGLGGGGAEVTG